MCDYSLHSVRSRSATIGDRLVTRKFHASLTRGFTAVVTRGFTAVNEPAVAICLRPGAELAFDRSVEYGPPFARWLPFLRQKPVGRLARFRRINVEREDAHHDALEFADGTIVLVTNLRPGQHATILQLAKDAATATEPEDRGTQAGRVGALTADQRAN